MLVLRLIRCLAAGSALLATLPALAELPARAGRLGLVEGEVTFRIHGRDRGNPADYSWPIGSGAILETGPGGRAEVQVDSTTFRLAGESGAEFTAVDDQRITLEVLKGSLAVTVRDTDRAAEIEIGTPLARIRLDVSGRYRIDADREKGSIRVSSREGSAYIHRPGGDLSVPGGQSAVLRADGAWHIENVQGDSFDAWADARDARLVRRPGPYGNGWEELHGYGHWTVVPGYGPVWYPRAAPPPRPWYGPTRVPPPGREFTMPPPMPPPPLLPFPGDRGASPGKPAGQGHERSNPPDAR